MPPNGLKVTYVSVKKLKPSEYNPRKWDKKAIEDMRTSIGQFGVIDPLLVNEHPERTNIVIGGHLRLKVAKDVGITRVPVVYVNFSLEREKRLNLLLNKVNGEWDFELLAKFDESLLKDVGFTSEELDEVFGSIVDVPEQFDVNKALEQIDVDSITAQKGNVYQLGDSRLMVGDSTIAADFEKLMAGQKADMCLTDPPYILDYLHGKRHGKPTTGFGVKKNRRYLETESLPDNFTELWMNNIAASAKPDFSIICYENWKNLRVIWSEMEKYWKVKNMLVWHIANRHQGYAANHKFFSKYDIAMVGASGTVQLNEETEPDGLQEEYDTALYGIAGSPQWEGYAKGKRYLPTDFIEFQADDLKSSGQSVVFGTKPVEILLPYIKVLTKRNDLVVEPFCGSGSTLIAATKLKRRCFTMEKVPAYAEVAMKRWETLTGLKRKKLD